MEEMKPGAELDRFVAEKVCGLTAIKATPRKPVTVNGCFVSSGVWATTGARSTWGPECCDFQRYSTDLSTVASAASDWCDKRDRPTWWEVESASPGFDPLARIKEGSVEIALRYGQTPAHALSLALLAAVEGPK